MADLTRLYEAARQSASPVVVSFPLRMSGFVQLVMEIVDSGKNGTVEHVQAVNNVPYGGVYFQDWYRDEQETGGLFLQKATHVFDYIHHIIGGTPVRIGAMTSKRVFRGDKPAGLRSALIFLKKRESAETSAFLEIEPVTRAMNGEPAPSSRQNGWLGIPRNHPFLFMHVNDPLLRFILADIILQIGDVLADHRHIDKQA